MDIHAQGNHLLALTNAMLVLAQTDAWDEFELLEQQRSDILNRIFGNPDNAESARLHWVDMIKEIQRIDETIRHLICQQRNQAAEELRYLKQAHEGNKAYQAADDAP